MESLIITAILFGVTVKTLNKKVVGGGGGGGGGKDTQEERKKEKKPKKTKQQRHVQVQQVNIHGCSLVTLTYSPILFGGAPRLFP